MAASKRLFEETQEAAPAQKAEIIWHTDSLWTSATQGNMNKALLKFHQMDLHLKKDKTVPVGGGRNRSYTTLDELVSKVKPALAECGIILQQHLAGSEVVTILTHISGEFIASKLSVIPMQGNNVNAIQQAGGGYSYLKRYSLSAILCLVGDEEDTDGATSSISPDLKPKGKPTPPDTKLGEMVKFLQAGGTMDQINAKYELTYLQKQFIHEQLKKEADGSAS